MSDNNIEIVTKEQCTGCGACMYSCPKEAITFQADDEGFPSPNVDSKRCVGCGLCVQTCPAMNPPGSHNVRCTYAAQIKDKEALLNSSSGGMFTAFSREIINSNGVVFGCVWDNQYNAYIRKAENEHDIEEMRGSKYVWSWAGDSFVDVENELKSGRKVLFTGLPCQVAGLKKYLKKDYENLIAVDFLCSGSPSPLIFHKWLETICRSNNYEDLNLKFRDKNPYGLGVHITYSGQKKGTNPRGDTVFNTYYYSFYSHLLDRRSCYYCPYGTNERVSDITISDYWGIGKWHPELDANSGFSAMLINTEKGEEFLEGLKNAVILVPTKIENIASANNLNCNGVSRKRMIPEKREALFEKTKSEGWESAAKHINDFNRIKQMVIAKTPLSVIKFAKKVINK